MSDAVREGPKREELPSPGKKAELCFWAAANK